VAKEHTALSGLKLLDEPLENPKRKEESESLGAARVGGEARGIDAGVVGPVGLAALADIHAPLHHAKALASSSSIHTYIHLLVPP
jgi:hypothetical protein